MTLIKLQGLTLVSLLSGMPLGSSHEACNLEWHAVGIEVSFSFVNGRWLDRTRSWRCMVVYMGAERQVEGQVVLWYTANVTRLCSDFGYGKLMPKIL